MQTIAVIVAIFMAAWVIRGDIAKNAAMIAGNTAAISQNTAAVAELRGALLAHIGGHSHSPKIAAAEDKEDKQ